MEHFSHEHPLTLSEKEIDVQIPCQGCGKALSGLVYGCNGCEFYLHKSCTELADEIEHFFHSCRLILQKDRTSASERTIICNGCKKCVTSFRYRCEQCDFNLDVECALLPTRLASCCLQPDPDSSNQHGLELIEKEEDDRVTCKVCRTLCWGPTFACNGCGYFVHQSCMNKVNQEVINFRHPCPLLLKKLTPYWCGVCDESRSGVVFRCEKCNLNLDVECVLRHKTIVHFSHGHPLTLCEKKDGDEADCKGCGKNCLGSTYSCIRCSFCLHKTCCELQREILHPFHQQHPLRLHFKAFRCGACCMHSRGFTYHCSMCDFDLHIECASLVPSINYEGHEHLLTFIEHLYGEPCCKLCDSKFSGTSYLRCVECNFSVHFLCSPLPHTIKHHRHIHPLSLEDCYIEDDSGEYYCDFCEEERDPLEPVYYCKEGDFVTHVRCVISEVLPKLEGEFGTVKLKRADRQVAVRILNRNFFSFNDMVESFTDEEQRESNLVRAAFLKEVNEIANKVPEDHLANYTDGLLKYDAYSDEDFFLFGATIQSDFSVGLTMKSSDREAEIISVGRHKITRELLPLFQDLMKKYGDFTAESKLSPNVKAYYLVVFCRTIHNICNTMVMEVRPNLLNEWWINCKIVQHAGFKVQFAFEHLNKVAYARFALESELSAGTILDDIDKSITKISVEIEERTRKLEELKLKRKRHISSTRFARANLSEESLAEALELRLHAAGDGLV